jgi:hypothetical protein
MPEETIMIYGADGAYEMPKAHFDKLYFDSISDAAVQHYDKSLSQNNHHISIANGSDKLVMIVLLFIAFSLGLAIGLLGNKHSLVAFLTAAFFGGFIVECYHLWKKHKHFFKTL